MQTFLDSKPMAHEKKIARAITREGELSNQVVVNTTYFILLHSYQSGTTEDARNTA